MTLLLEIYLSPDKNEVTLSNSDRISLKSVTIFYSLIYKYYVLQDLRTKKNNLKLLCYLLDLLT